MKNDNTLEHKTFYYASVLCRATLTSLHASHVMLF